MKKFNFLKKLNCSYNNFKIFTLFLFALLIFLPLLVFAINEINTIEGGWQQLKNNGTTDVRLVYWNTNNDKNNIQASPNGVCVVNSSSNDYFIPTRTLSEWNNFFATTLARPALGVTVADSTNAKYPCVGDGVCNLNLLVNEFGLNYCIIDPVYRCTVEGYDK